MKESMITWGCGLVCNLICISCLPADEPSAGFVSLFNGVDFEGWTVPEGDDRHWRVVDGVIDYDARSEAEGGNDGRSLWSKKAYRDFELRLEWRFKPEGGLRHRVPLILPSGDYDTDREGNQKQVEVLDAGDSGIYLRGSSKSQVNMWCWPIGSGEVYGYRTDKSMPAEVRAGVTPSTVADKAIGKWNRFIITMKGDRLTVNLNGQTVLENAQLPGVAERGPIALQHHGDPIEFANIFIKQLDQRPRQTN